MGQIRWKFDVNKTNLKSSLTSHLKKVIDTIFRKQKIITTNVLKLRKKNHRTFALLKINER